MTIDEAIAVLERQSHVRRILADAERHSPAAKAAGNYHRNLADAIETVLPIVKERKP